MFPQPLDLIPRVVQQVLAEAHAYVPEGAQGRFYTVQELVPMLWCESDRSLLASAVQPPAKC